MVVEKLVVEKEKIGFVVGKAGRAKKEIEKELDVVVTVSRSGTVSVSGEALNVHTALKVVEALVLGFCMEDALLLCSPDYVLEIVSIKQYAKTKSRLKEIKARVIGRKGMARKNLERLGGVEICIGENFIGIIGRVEEVAVARGAVETLLQGAPHGKVYKKLESSRPRRK